MVFYNTLSRPSALPIDLSEAKDHLRVIGSDEDALIRQKIRTAMAHVENLTGHILTPGNFEYSAKAFDDVVKLDRYPVTAVSSIQYSDASNNLQTLPTDDYIVNLRGFPVTIEPGILKTWPSTANRHAAVIITFAAGYTQSNLPAELKEAILLVLSFLYDNRGDEGHRTLPKTIVDLIHPLKQMIS